MKLHWDPVGNWELAILNSVGPNWELGILNFATSWDPIGSWEFGSLSPEMTAWEAILGNKTTVDRHGERVIATSNEMTRLVLDGVSQNGSD